MPQDNLSPLRIALNSGMTSTPIRIAVAGALGRMGQVVATVVEARPGAILGGRFDRPDTPLKPGLVTQEEALADADVVVDFTTGAASAALALYCAEHGGPAIVIGATGFTAAEERILRAAARRVPIVKTGNYSLGVNMLMGLVRQAAAALPASVYDIEIFEAHHKRKADAPSGTALMLGEAAAEGRGVDLFKVQAKARDGMTGPRPEGQIGFSVMRGGGVVGEHSVSFLAEDEVLTLTHSAQDRGLFARGAVEAAVWLAGRAPGLYDMQDVLGFTTVKTPTPEGGQDV
jgi:4-hydroxy-tetrahydrodipicolinate reductase